jgi:uncharacterized protein
MSGPEIVPVQEGAALTTSSAQALPVQASERIAYLDVLRGFALAGILFMNIRGFGMIFAAYGNPAIYDWLSPLDLAAFSFTSVFFDLKFMTLFSIMFGAGIILFSERVKKRTGKSAIYHYRRMIVLLAIGLIHAYGIWQGDILVFYATFGMIAYLFRNLKVGWLIPIAILLFLIPSLLSLASGMSLDKMPAEDRAGLESFWEPSAEEVARETAVFRNGYGGQFQERVKTNAFMYSMGFLFFGTRVLGNILLGMILFKTGVITGQRTDRFYRRLLWGLAIGLPLIGYGLYQNFQQGWSFEYSFFLGNQFNYWGSFGVVFGYIGLIALWSRSGLWQGLQDRLAAFGRMAFTNYLMQSVICTLLFYGIGLGLFGTMGYATQLLVVLAVLALELWWSPLWFKYYRYGPMEWLWRSATYWRWQPNRIPG